MRIGFTYDTVGEWSAEDLSPEQLAEFDSVTTIDAIAGFLERRGHIVDRIGRARRLIARLHGGDRWDIVFNICEGQYGMGREALVPALLEAEQIPFTFSDSVALALTLHKAHTKRIVRDAGLPTAPFAVLDEPEAMALSFPVFAKPVAEGTGKGIGSGSCCTCQADLDRLVIDLRTRFAQPVLVETYLPGREFTVGIVGDGEVIGVMEIESPDVYGFDVKKHYENVRYRLADDAEAHKAGKIALDAWHLLGCRDAGRVDLRSDARGMPMILEVNALPGLHPVDSDLVILARNAGRDHDWLLDRIMHSACTRAGLSW
jgi:D-alanine-D-alanine ligase